MPDCVDCHRYDARRRLCSVTGGSPIRKCVIAMLERECPTYRGRVLEIGCGGWDFAKRLCESAGCQWFGIDPMTVDTKGRPSIATARGVVTDIPYPDAHFDVVLGTQTLEHWSEWGSDYFRGLDEIHRVLKVGGLLSLNFPIHFHGHPMFVRGDEAAIRSLFRPGQWRIDKFEYWRRGHQPLPVFRGWRACNFTDESVCGAASSCQAQLHAVKLGGLAPDRSGDESIRRKLSAMTVTRPRYFYRERLLPDQPRWTERIGEHLARYQWATEDIAGKRVLDIGCGAGMGTQLLAQRGAAEVVGLDYADQALAVAAATFTHPRVTWVLGDAESLDNVAGPFDRVIAFDVFERLHEPERMLSRCAALLAPGGDFLCSTPDTTSLPKRPDGTPENPFHVREYTATEFESALKKWFGRVELLSQDFTTEYARLLRLHRRRARFWRRVWRRLRRLYGRSVVYSPPPPPSADDFVIVPLTAGTARVFVARCGPPRTG